MDFKKNANGKVDVTPELLGGIVDSIVTGYHIVKNSGNDFAAEELRESALLLALFAQNMATARDADLAKHAATKPPIQ
jgi:hypothetical protein